MRTYEDVDAEIKYLIRDMNYASLTRREYEAADDMMDEWRELLSIKVCFYIFPLAIHYRIHLRRIRR